MRRILLILLLLLPSWSQAAESDLTVTQQRLEALRDPATFRKDWKDPAPPGYGAAKQYLLRWLQGRIQTLRPGEDLGPLTQQIKADLLARGLVCHSEGTPDCPADEQGILPQGYVFAPGLVWLNGGQFLLLTTGLGVSPIGFDDSAYLFQHHKNGWRLVWRDEQRDYRQGHFHLNAVGDVQVSSLQNGKRLILSVADHWSPYSSNWGAISYRLWQWDLRTGRQDKLLDRSEYAYLGVDRPYEAKLTATDIWIGFHAGSIDTGVHNYHAIRHFKVAAGKAQRVAPYALTPRNFIEEWLQGPDLDGLRWGAPGRYWWRRQMRKRDLDDYGELNTCANDPSLRQVGLGVTYDEKKPIQPLYITLRILGGGDYKVLSIGFTPRPGCDAEAPEAETAESPLTLFLRPRGRMAPPGEGQPNTMNHFRLTLASLDEYKPILSVFWEKVCLRGGRSVCEGSHTGLQCILPGFGRMKV